MQFHSAIKHGNAVFHSFQGEFALKVLDFGIIELVICVTCYTDLQLSCTVQCSTVMCICTSYILINKNKQKSMYSCHEVEDGFRARIKFLAQREYHRVDGRWMRA